MKKYPNVYLTLKGKPGTGKGFVLQHVKDMLRKMNIGYMPESDNSILMKSEEILAAYKKSHIGYVQEDKPVWKHYTVGFCFNHDLSKVILIKKAKPAWQAGRYNGVGGSFEGQETSIECMDREFKEEVNWKPIYTYESIDWVEFAQGEIRCHQGDCFLHYMTGFMKYREMFYPTPQIGTREVPEWISVDSLPIDVVPNLHFLVPMARNVFTKVWWSEKAIFRTLI